MSRSRILNLANVQQFAAINVLSDPGAIGGPKQITQGAEIVLTWNIASGKLAHNVLIGQFTGGFAGSQGQANAIITGLTTGAQWTALAAHLAPTCALTNVSIRNLHVRDQPIIPALTPGQNGTSTGTELPNEVAACLTLRTGLTGAANRGRIFIPGWATTALGPNNTIAAAAVTALGNWGSIIAGVLSAQGYVLSVGHVARAAYTGSTGTQHPARESGCVPVTAVNVRDNHWDSQRRRGLK